MGSWLAWIGLLAFGGVGCLPGGKAEFEQTCTPAPHIEGNPPRQATATHPYTALFTGGYNCGFAGGCFALEPLSLPSGASIDPYSQAVHWTPPGSLAGTTQTLAVATPYDPCGDRAVFRWQVAVLPAPAIQAFTASPLSVPPGGTTTLLPVFTGGTGRIVLWTGGTMDPVASGVAISSPPLAVTTTFELIVTNALGDGTSSTVTVTVE